MPEGRGGSSPPKTSATLSTTSIHQTPFNFLQNTAHILQNIFVAKAKHLETEALHERIALSVIALRFFGVMNLAIELNDQLCRGAIEIDDVISKAVLAAKFFACELRFFQAIPE